MTGITQLLFDSPQQTAPASGFPSNLQIELCHLRTPVPTPRHFEFLKGLREHLSSLYAVAQHLPLP